MTERRAAFVVASTTIAEPTRLQSYVEQIPATLAHYGGRIRIVGPVTALEGSAPSVAAVVEFPDVVAAATWHDSLGQAAIRGIPHAGGPTGLWLIEPAWPASDPRGS